MQGTVGMHIFNRTIDTIPYDTGLEALVCVYSLLVVPEVLKRH